MANPRCGLPLASAQPRNHREKRLIRRLTAVSHLYKTKILEQVASPSACPTATKATLMVNTGRQNIFNGLFRVPVKKKKSAIKFYLMGGQRRRNLLHFQWPIIIISRHIEGAALFFCAGANGSLTKLTAGNYSRASH